MKIPDIELYNMSRFRGEQMGAAMLFIILFHVGLDRWDPMFGLRRMGNVGVDIFLFLSGIGLWYSWTKMTEKGMATKDMLLRFFKNRYVRIYPAWLIMASLYYIPRFHGGDIMAWIDLIGDITINWDFWLHDELTFWYIPAIMMLYTISPFYMMLIQRHPMYRWLPLISVIWCVMVQWVIPIHQTVGHLEIFWSRVPIFLLGINFGSMVKNRHTIDGQAVWMLAAIWILTFGTCLYLEQIRHGHFPLFVERMLYIPFTITTIMLLNRVFRRLPDNVNMVFRFVGAVSLEAYLIHSHFVLCYIERMHIGYWPTFLLTALITMPLAWLLHKGIEKGKRVKG